MKEIGLGSGIDDDEPIRLRDLRSNLCQMFRARDANRNRQAQLCSHAASNGARNFRRRSKQMSTPCYVCESLINREPFDERCVVGNNLDRGIPQPLILIEMATDENEL